MADKKRGLGRGLSALIGDVDIGLSADTKAPTKGKPNKGSDGLVLLRRAGYGVIADEEAHASIEVIITCAIVAHFRDDRGGRAALLT